MTIFQNTRITTAEKETWNGKQDALGFTPENVANKGEVFGYCPLDGGSKIPLANMPLSVFEYVGTWNALTNYPELISPDLTKVGSVYDVDVAGTQFGIDFTTDDKLIYNSLGIPEKSGGGGAVSSVNGKTGTVLLDKTDIALGNVLNVDTTTTENITDSLNKRFVTDAEKATLANQSGTNTGDQDLSSYATQTYVTNSIQSAILDSWAGAY